MKYIILLVTLALSFNLFAETIKDQIHSLDIGKNGQDHLVKLNTGRVAFIDYYEKTLLREIEASLKRNDWLELTLGKKSTLEEFKIIPSESIERPLTGEPPKFQDPYSPSVVTPTTATSIFNKMRQRWTSKGQCFNRAHIWTYEEHKRSKLNLNKVFLFFTSKYIRNYRFGWWFHVTPMVYVGGTKNINMRMLDRKYTSGTRTSKTWTDIFIKSKTTCPIISKYSYYRDNQRTRDCYLLPTSMYYLVPSDIDRREYDGTERTSYDELDVEYAYWDAFKISPP
jgi:hypothetical protein